MGRLRDAVLKAFVNSRCSIDAIRSSLSSTVLLHYLAAHDPRRGLRGWRLAGSSGVQPRAELGAGAVLAVEHDARAGCARMAARRFIWSSVAELGPEQGKRWSIDPRRGLARDGGSPVHLSWQECAELGAGAGQAVEHRSVGAGLRG